MIIINNNSIEIHAKLNYFSIDPIQSVYKNILKVIKSIIYSFNNSSLFLNLEFNAIKVP